MEEATPVATKRFVAIGNVSRYLWFMRSLVLVLALLVGFGSTDAFAKDAVLVKLRDGDKPAAKPTPTKSSAVRAKKKTPVRRTKAVAKSKPKPKKKPAAKSEKSEDTRVRPMP